MFKVPTELSHLRWVKQLVWWILGLDVFLASDLDRFVLIWNRTRPTKWLIWRSFQKYLYLYIKGRLQLIHFWGKFQISGNPPKVEGRKKKRPFLEAAAVFGIFGTSRLEVRPWMRRSNPRWFWRSISRPSVTVTSALMWSVGWLILGCFQE